MRYSLKPVGLFLISFLCLAGALTSIRAATFTTYPVGTEPKAVASADFNRIKNSSTDYADYTDSKASLDQGAGFSRVAQSSRYRTWNVNDRTAESVYANGSSGQLAEHLRK